MALADDTPIGSRWYAWGHHYEIVDEGEWDGERSVTVKRIDRGRKPTVLRIPFEAKRLVQFGLRTDQEGEGR